MKRLLADNELEKLSSYVALQMGLHFPPSKWQSLEQAFFNAAGEMGFNDQKECMSWFMSAPPSQELYESMASYLTIGETYFLREARCFEVLEQQIIPDIVKKRQGKEQRLRIWSSGCSTGEEPYSIAILLHRMRAALRNWEVSILATDINPVALRKAMDGEYRQWSFRNTPAGFKESYFTESEDGRFKLLPAIKEMVTFSSFNLAEECYPSLVTGTNAIDVIFCRNVLMYFTPQLAAQVVARYRRCLLDGGWLFVSPCETSNPVFSGFRPINYPDAILYQKSHRGAATEAQKISCSPSVPAPPVQAVAVPPPLLRQDCHDKPSEYRRALTLYEQGAYREAEEIVLLQLTLDTNDTASLALLCRIYANEGRLSEALGVSDRAIAADKLSSGLHYLRAVILQELGMNSEASASLKKALYLDQNLVMAHFTLATLEQRKGKVKESRRHFNVALSLLDSCRPDDIIPESEGMFAGRLTEIIRTTSATM
jgi:chemotaxis protein methyltransferase CheR